MSFMTKEENNLFHANYKYMWNKLSTTYYHVKTGKQAISKVAHICLLTPSVLNVSKMAMSQASAQLTALYNFTIKIFLPKSIPINFCMRN